MTSSPIVTITVPADVRFFRSVRLAVGGLATMVGFDIEAIDDLRIGVDEVCAALIEAGNGDDLRLEITAEVGVRLRIDGRVPCGPVEIDEERFAFSRQILSVVADEFGYTADGPSIHCWVERRLADDQADGQIEDPTDDGESVSSARSGSDGDPSELTEAFERYRATNDRAVRNQLVNETRSLAEACARRFANRGEPLEDLEQVALLGLVKAVERFDPRFGVPFGGFAVPTITGELRRHFRDTTWSLKVPRRSKDLHVRIPAAIERLRAAAGRSPTPAELAEDLGVGIDDVLDALDAGSAYRTTSTDTTEGALAAGHATAAQPADGLAPDERVLLGQLLDTLPERERTIVYLRFFEDLSQSEIAERVGMSQVHVSRLLRRSLRDLREQAGA